ncbi:hypothetical protein HPP92_002310 [Vanilla planifolia]|uniref:Uncharacterized protein n=1 Tax=Vanilla planifolia TaxID=51239 RepID=A0A835VEE0_VANPL|nr:hypothetical protein HPP92_002310 [Vanilla planifolia]
MFTEGLDANALQWVQEGHPPVSNTRQRMHSPPNFEASGSRLGIPPPEKFKSGHLPVGSIPATHAMPLPGDTESGSDMDESSDTDEIYAVRHSSESSCVPQNYISKQALLDGACKVHDGITQRVAQQNNYSSDGYSTYSSSGDAADMRPPLPGKRTTVNGYFDEEGDEWSDSADSFGFKGKAEKKGSHDVENPCFRDNGKCIYDKARMALGGNCRDQDYYPSGDSCEDVDPKSLKDKHSNIPSAPPFDGHEKEIAHASREMSSTRLNCTTISQVLNGSYVKEEILVSNSEKHNSDVHFKSTSSGIKEGTKTCSLQTRRPKFHASEQGPWHCILAYDACVRLCLHCWASGCLDAPPFLENECALLRKAFSLQQILLQPMEELLGQQCSGSICEGSQSKSKNVIGKIKVQVRKVKMSPNMPSGCSTSLNLATMNIKTIKCCMSNLCSMLSTKWKSLRGACFLQCVPIDSCFSKLSLACINANAQYAKKVSSLLKVGAANMQTSALFGLMEEAHTCRLKLKSSVEEEVVEMNPGIGETHSLYLSYTMDVATPTADCLMLVHDLLLPVIEKSCKKNGLSHQENRILGEIREQIEEILSLVFENYKSLDESSPSGLVEDFEPANGNPSPTLAYGVKLYTLVHDILSPEAQLKLCSYFEVAVKKRSRRHMFDTDEIFASSIDGTLLDVGVSKAYQKMINLCYNISHEISTDIEIQNHHVLPSFVDLPNISASIYSVELCTRLRSFLKACPPTGPSSPVADLVIATADFQKNLASWNLSPVKGSVDAKELFHLYIVLWIQEKRLELLESCKLDKVKLSGVRTRHLTTPFIEEVYDRLKETLNEYEVIMCRWPEYIFVLENAIADVEKTMLEALEKQYSDVLTPLKDSIAPKRLGFKCIHKLAKGRKVCPYIIPDELGIFMNTMKRLLDVLGPGLEKQLKSWGSCMPDAGSVVPGERLNEVAVTFRSLFRNYLQAVVEKLAENTRLQNATNLKKILQESRAVVLQSDVRKRMQQLREHLMETINHIHKVFEVNVFVSVCRCLWNRLGQDVLKFLENHKENRSWYKASRATIAVLDETFASEMQHLLGNTLQQNDLEPPRSIIKYDPFSARMFTRTRGSTTEFIHQFELKTILESCVTRDGTLCLQKFLYRQAR